MEYIVLCFVFHIVISVLPILIASIFTLKTLRKGPSNEYIDAEYTVIEETSQKELNDKNL